MSALFPSNDSETTSHARETEEMVDVTSLFKEGSKSLTVTDPMLCNKESFNLQDSMAALELMDPKMDCCEIPASQVAPVGRTLNQTDKDENRRVFPRPAPVGLDDVTDPLPWNELTVEDAAFIALECLVRLESLLSGASVVESTFTCLYAHRPVVMDMKACLVTNGKSSTSKQQEDGMKTGDMDQDNNSRNTSQNQEEHGTMAQRIVYASILMLLELTDVIRGIILNADIYEEEDFTVSTYGIEVFDDRDDKTALHYTNELLSEMEKSKGVAAESSSGEVDHIKTVSLTLRFQVDLLSICSCMARLSGSLVTKKVEQSQKLAQSAATKLEEARVLANRMESEKGSIKALLQRTFDSNVNRPLVGNAPVRKISFQDVDECLQSLIAISKEMDWALCRTILKGNSVGRIRRMAAHISVSSTNILTRSLLVLNLYFDDKLFGQYSLPEKIIQHMKQLSSIHDDVFQNKAVQAFVSRLAKPIYDVLKVPILNRNRQRAYIEGVMLYDWASLSQEARIVDLSLANDPRFGHQIPPHFSLYVLYTTIDLMDHYVALGIELKLFCSEHEIAVAYWYRDFLLSALINQLNTMRQIKAEAKQVEQQAVANSQISKRGKKKGGRNHKKQTNGNNRKGPTPEDIEDESEFLIINLKRILCRGSVRFLACADQASLIPERPFEFTSKERIFRKRFEAFEPIQQPPLLQYADYLAGSDFSKVQPEDLIVSTAECFNAAKAYVDRLMEQSKVIAEDYQPIQETEIRSFAKVCIGNSVYIQKLRQEIESATTSKNIAAKSKAKITFDMDASEQFCTIKLS